MPTAPPVKLVTFDLGGVFIRISSGWEQAAKLANIKLPLLPKHEDVEPHLVKMETGNATEEDFCNRVAPLAGLAEEDVRSVLRAWLLGPYQEIESIVDQLCEKRVATACLSNTNACHWKLMQEDGPNRLPLDRLTFRFASHLIGVMKPNAGIYEHLEQQTGVAPESILFFDDRPENCQAARQRGWQAVQIDPTGDTVKQMATALRERSVI